MFRFFSPFKRGILSNSEVTRPLSQKIYRSFIMLYTAPFTKGDKITIERYTGVVQRMDIWYLKLKSINKCVYIPTSHIYDKSIEVYE
ncbi:hypothetical protein PAEPH01_0318 [Pancytospora epiphaga]|nr:hypothetical protein PAEPH01_0318 [Pancytospora epiphaga]